jgi:hypothetical protein
MKTIAIAAAAALSMGSAYAQPVLSGHRSTAPEFVYPKKKGTVLVNQTSGGAGIGIVSQNFESTYAIYDSADADSFTVPKGSTWTITEVVANGTYFNGSGPATSEEVTFYKSKKGAPTKKGVKACSYATVKGKDSSGAFTIELPTACVLKAGTYWVSVVANLAFSDGGEWGWNDATDTGPAQADWENPMGGFAIGCTKWTAELTCIADGQANGKDYELIGTSK